MKRDETEILRALGEILSEFESIEQIGPLSIRAMGMRIIELANIIDMKMGNVTPSEFSTEKGN